MGINKMDVSEPTAQWIASTRSLAAKAVKYGVVARRRGDEIDLTLTFLAGESYCCMEPGCHIGLAAPAAWEEIANCLGFSVTALNLTTIVEKGAVIAGHVSRDVQRYQRRR